MRPDDIILGDADGVVVIPREHAPEHAPEILGKAQAAIAKEQQLRKRIEEGEFIFEIPARFPPRDLATSPEAPESLQLIGEKDFPPPGWVVFSLHFSNRAV